MNRRSFFGALLAAPAAIAVLARKAHTTPIAAADVQAEAVEIRVRPYFDPVWIENPDVPDHGVYVYRSAQLVWDQA